VCWCIELRNAHTHTHTHTYAHTHDTHPHSYGFTYIQMHLHTHTQHKAKRPHALNVGKLQSCLVLVSPFAPQVRGVGVGVGVRGVGATLPVFCDGNLCQWVNVDVWVWVCVVVGASFPVSCDWNVCEWVNVDVGSG
jgi:hypothetical protein